MKNLEYDKKKLYKNWDECGIDLESYNKAIRKKVNKIELILEKSKWQKNKWDRMPKLIIASRIIGFKDAN